jgi:hypothetical protein
MAHVAKTNEHNGYGFYYDTDEPVKIPNNSSSKTCHGKTNIYTLDENDLANKAVESRPVISFIFSAIQYPLKYIMCIGVVLSSGCIAGFVWVMW